MDGWQPYMSQSETVRFIRSLLLTRKEMYTLGEFLRDFEERTGYDLPSFGCGNSMEFLKTIPETVQVITVKNDIYLKLIENEQYDYWNRIAYYGWRHRRRRHRPRGGGRRRQNARKEKQKNESTGGDHSESPSE